MSNIFFASDHHFHHKNILTFKNSDDTPLRVFDDVDHMNEHMVYCHNRVVRPTDKVYFLGDVCMSRNAKGLEILGRMNGEKVLIKGNHDLANASQYLQYFKDIRGSHQFDGMILTHIPIHPESLARWGLNVHGHLHNNVVMIRGFADKPIEPDPRYFNVSMERINFTPISLEEVKKYVRMPDSRR
jgi:calcineurin-like phosphoesterase family protein